jgi:hypothetical protein
VGPADLSPGGQLSHPLHHRSDQAQSQAQGPADPVTQKNPEALQASQATCQERLSRAIPPENTRPVRVFSQDESRVGLLTVRRRRLTTRGVQPVGSVQHVFEWFDVYGAVAPTTRECCLLVLPSLNAETCQIFVDASAHACPDHLDILLVDNSGAHTAIPPNGCAGPRIYTTFGCRPIVQSSTRLSGCGAT